jgi:hypothetical protein
MLPASRRLDEDALRFMVLGPARHSASCADRHPDDAEILMAQDRIASPADQGQHPPVLGQDVGLQVRYAMLGRYLQKGVKKVGTQPTPPGR